MYTYTSIYQYTSTRTMSPYSLQQTTLLSLLPGVKLNQNPKKSLPRSPHTHKHAPAASLLVFTSPCVFVLAPYLAYVHEHLFAYEVSFE